MYTHSVVLLPVNGMNFPGIMTTEIDGIFEEKGLISLVPHECSLRLQVLVCIA